MPLNLAVQPVKFIQMMRPPLNIGFALWLSLMAFQVCAVTARTATETSLPLHAQQSCSVLLAASDHLTLPVQITKGYVFLEGKVNGLSGVFLFDTGSPFPFFLNRDYIPLKLKKYISTGRAGSGQVLKVYQPEDVGAITLASSVLNGVEPLRCTDFSFMTDMKKDGIRPDILGIAGLPLFSDYQFELNYAASTLDIYRLNTNSDPVISHVKPQDIVAILPFRYSSNHLPFSTLVIDGFEIDVMFDTGTQGDLVLTPSARRALVKTGRLRPSGNSFVIEGLTYQATALTADVPLVKTGKRNTLKAGYSFLRHYRSVWNFKKQTITLLKQ